MRKRKCCICGKSFKGFGNNPWGALDYNGDPIKWKDNDECCDSCNDEFVIPGRIYLQLNKRY